MKPSEVKVGDVIHKPPFWSRPVKVVGLFSDRDGRYADVEVEGEPSHIASFIPLVISRGTQDHLLDCDIKRIERNGELVYKREPDEQA